MTSGAPESLRSITAPFFELPASPHRASFERFLQRDVAPHERGDLGLQGVLRGHFPVITADGLAALEFVSYEVQRPKFDADDCRRLGRTYAAPLKVTIRLVIWELHGGGRAIRDVKEQELYFGEVPLLTDDDVFVAAGQERAPLLFLGVVRGLACAALWQDDPRAVVDALMIDRSTKGAWRVAGVGDHLAEAAWRGVAAMVAKTRERMERAVAMDSVETMMPHDLLMARPLSRAFLTLLERSPRVQPLDLTNPLARVAHGWKVAVDEVARAALPGSSCARWFTPSREGLAALSPDAPLRADGALDEGAPPGDLRSLAARIALDADALLRALPLADAMAPPSQSPLARAVAVRGGALVLALRAGTVHRVSERRVWVIEDGAAEPACYALARSGAPRVVTALSLRPRVAQGARVAAGDVLAEGAAVASGTLALGRRCAVTHQRALAPGTCRVSTRCARALRSLARERVEVQVRDTRLGCQELTRDVPGETPHALRHLDASGVAVLGAEVEPGDVLAGRVSPTAAGGMDDAAARARVRGTVIEVEAFARRGRDRNERHEAIVAAMKDDLRVGREERVACLSALGAAEGDARWRDEERLLALDRGDDLPPGVVSVVRMELLVEREVVRGDELADGIGGRWVVADVTDYVDGEVELPGEGVNGEVYLMRLRIDAPEKRAPKRAKKASERQTP